MQLNGHVSATIAADALLGLLLPFWQIVIGASVRLAGRGRSRMNTAILVTRVALVGVVLLGVLIG